MTRVLIVAPYASLRAGLHALVAEAEDCTVVGEVGGSEELDSLLETTRPDVLLADISGGTDDLPCLIELALRGRAGLVALGEGSATAGRLASSALHGWAYLHPEADGDEIGAAVRAVAAGLVVLDGNHAALLKTAAVTSVPARDLIVAEGGDSLTAREREVLQLIAQGLANKNIAARLTISLSTVKFHVASILAKLDASSRTEAVTTGARRGYVLL